MQRLTRLKLAALLLGSAVFLFTVVARSQESIQQNRPLDPKAWGGNHVGKPVPAYTTGDECLFCHRNTIGPSWAKDAHARTLRMREDAAELSPLLKGQAALTPYDKQVEYFLGFRNVMRLLKKDGYGKFAMLSAQATLTADAKGGKSVAAWQGLDKLAWDKQKFYAQCAGCHASGVDTQAKTFSAFGIECYMCHGEVPDEHSNKPELVWFAKKRSADPRAIISACASCHLRDEASSVKSVSTGLPYPNNFVTGDNLFQDLIVDWKQADNDKLNPGDRHVWRNARDVAFNIAGNDEKMTCLSCHQIHEAQGADATLRHRNLPRTPICFDCHRREETEFKEHLNYVVKSSVCEY